MDLWAASGSGSGSSSNSSGGGDGEEKKKRWRERRAERMEERRVQGWRVRAKVQEGGAQAGVGRRFWRGWRVGGR